MFHFWSSSSARPTATERFHTCSRVREQSWDTNRKRVDVLHQEEEEEGQIDDVTSGKLKGKRSGGGRRREAIMGRRKGRRGRDRASWRTMNAGGIQQGTKTESDSIGLFYPAAIVAGRKRFLCGCCVGAELMKATNRILFFPTQGRGLCD